LDQWGDVTPDSKLCQEFFFHSANFQAGSGIFVRPLPFRISSRIVMWECIDPTLQWSVAELKMTDPA
jgi:hypothetical protein